VSNRMRYRTESMSSICVWPDARGDAHNVNSDD
jgi:hypothetical protein